ncbi:hypothetical protein K502DRAFT_4844 [Neoconidiobolus thromboides FSU 785]|nr:hypothetical protein K502DRAFT_4844 [Neoconidiobolus thromboides FSU 785]
MKIVIRSNPLWLPFFNEMGELMEIEMEDDSIEEMLLKLIDYLRDTYYYCIYCGIQFNDEKDMIDNCYGKLRADHDE